MINKLRFRSSLGLSIIEVLIALFLFALTAESALYLARLCMTMFHNSLKQSQTMFDMYHSSQEEKEQKEEKELPKGRRVNNEGRTLIELCISLAIGCLITLTCLQGLQLYKNIYFSSLKKITDQLTLLTVWQFLHHDLQNAGYRGCRSRDKSYPLVRLYFEPYKECSLLPHEGNIVFGFVAMPGACFGRLPMRICQRVASGAKVMVIYAVSKNSTSLAKSMEQSDNPILVEDLNGISENGLVLIDDCHQGDLFIANRVTDKKVYHDMGVRANVKRSLSKLYQETAQITELETVVYFLGASNRVQVTSTDPPSFSLFRDSLTKGMEEILTEITELDILYGQWQSDGFVYLKSDQISRWDNVQSVKIFIKTETATKTFVFRLRNARSRVRSGHNAYFNDSLGRDIYELD